MRNLLKLAAVAGTAAIAAGTAEARITRIEIAKTEPAFAGASFGAAGTYERLTGKAYGEVDPRSPANAGIQDISLAPHNARGMVEYVTDIDIVRPADRSKSNGVLFFNIVNRGNKGGLALFNADVRYPRRHQWSRHRRRRLHAAAGLHHDLVRLAARRRGREQPQHHDSAGRPKSRRNGDHRHRAQRVGDDHTHHDAQPVERVVHGACHYVVSDGEHRQ
jgi:hypothetical protein